METRRSYFITFLLAAVVLCCSIWNDSSWLSVEPNYVAILIWPVLTGVTGCIYTCWTDDHRFVELRRYFVIFVTVVIVSLIVNLWKLQGETEASNAQTSLSIDMLWKAVTYSYSHPKYSLMVLVCIVASSLLHKPQQDLGWDKKFSQGHWVGVATKWIAFAMSLWFYRLVRSQNVRNNLATETVSAAIPEIAFEPPVEEAKVATYTDWNDAVRDSTPSDIVSFGFNVCCFVGNGLGSGIIYVATSIQDFKEGVDVKSKASTVVTQLALGDVVEGMTGMMYVFIVLCLSVFLLFPTRFGKLQVQLSEPCENEGQDDYI